jgi:phosphohistidine phosphatase
MTESGETPETPDGGNAAGGGEAATSATSADGDATTGTDALGATGAGHRSRRVELYFLRHADAGDPAAWRGPDEERPLSAKGVKQARRLGRFLDRAGFAADAIVTSPKLRAAETAKAVGKALRVKVYSNARLASSVSLGELERVLDAADGARRIVLVGHDPDFSELVSGLSGGHVAMAKGALARVDVERPLVLGTGSLRWLIPPDALRG